MKSPASTSSRKVERAPARKAAAREPKRTHFALLMALHGDRGREKVRSILRRSMKAARGDVKECARRLTKSGIQVSWRTVYRYLETLGMQSETFDSEKT